MRVYVDPACPLRVRFGGGGTYSFVACLSRVTIDHASLWRRSAVPSRNGHLKHLGAQYVFTYTCTNLPPYCFACWGPQVLPLAAAKGGAEGRLFLSLLQSQAEGRIREGKAHARIISSLPLPLRRRSLYSTSEPTSTQRSIKQEQG